MEFFNFNKTESPLNSSSEFTELSISSGAEVVAKVTGKLDKPSASLFLKKGKAEEIQKQSKSFVQIL